MRKFARGAVIAAAVAAASAVATAALAAAPPPSLQSFGSAHAQSAFELSANGVAGFALAPEVAASFDHNAPLLSSFATSSVLTPDLALDAGNNLDIASRFTDYAGTRQPFVTPVTSPFLGLANGGHYSGVTFVPASNLRFRLGASLNSERLDSFHFDPAAPSGNLALSYNASQTRSLLGGVSWDVSDALGLDMTAISSDRSGVPLGFADASGIAPKSATQALGVSARLNVGQGWVTTASFSEGLTQLNPRAGLNGNLATSLREQSYSIAVAKHGLFGDDTLGVSLSRPAPSLAGSFSSLVGSGELPPLVVAQPSALAGTAAETDIQLGYVTNFLNGAVALQTNAAYQTNVQGQPGASSVALLSRAKIKF